MINRQRVRPEPMCIGCMLAALPTRQRTLSCSPAGAVELRKELAAAAELDLPPMLVFDYPTVAALTDHLLALMPANPAFAQQPATVRLKLCCVLQSGCSCHSTRMA